MQRYSKERKPNLQRPGGGNEAVINARAEGRTWARNTMAQGEGGGEREEQGVFKTPDFILRTKGRHWEGFNKQGNT